MNFIKNKKTSSQDKIEINSQIDKLSKYLIELKLKKMTRQAFKPHEFKHTKRELAQLLTLFNKKN